MINNLPTIYEVVTGITKQQSKEKNPNGSSKSNKYNSSKKSGLAERQKSPDLPPYKENNDIREDEEEDAEHDNTLCGACGDSYSNDEFWICCDLCEKWFHGECVRITPARAQHIKQWKCPGCSSKKARA